MNSEILLSAKGIEKSFSAKKVLAGLTLAIEPKKMCAIVGENGSGKSTLLRILVGELSQDKGEVVLLGRLGYCPQQPLIFPQLTVYENLYYFAAAYKLSEQAFARRTETLLNKLNYRQYLHCKVEHLSGGTQQKLNLSIALLNHPQLLILDEPYNGFDWETYQCFWQIVAEMKEKGAGILIVSHFQHDISYFDRLYTLKQGKLV